MVLKVVGERDYIACEAQPLAETDPDSDARIGLPDGGYL